MLIRQLHDIRWPLVESSPATGSLIFRTSNPAIEDQIKLRPPRVVPHHHHRSRVPLMLLLQHTARTCAKIQIGQRKIVDIRGMVVEKVFCFRS